MTQTINVDRLSDILVDVSYQDNGIRESIFKQHGNVALDEWVRHYRDVISHTPTDVMMRELVDLRVGMPSSVYGIKHVRSLVTDFPNNTVRMAMLYSRKNAPLVQVFSQMINLVRVNRMKLNVRYFTEVEREAAITWLLSDD